jgi:hypothetical protein
MLVRSLSAVALTLLLAGPATARAETKTPAQTKPAAAPAKAAPAAASTFSKGPSIGGWIGYEMGDLDGLQLRFDYVLPYQRLTPQVDLSLVGSIGYGYLTHSESVAGFGVDSTAHVLKLVPAARFTMPVSPQLSLFGDAGLGLYYASVSVDSSVPPSTSASDSSVGFMLRFGLGGFYKVNPKMQIGASFVVDPMFGDYDDTTFSILAGFAYQL